MIESDRYFSVDLIAKDLPGHVESSLSSHLQLTLDRLLEHQRVMAGVYSRLSEIEAVNDHQNKEIALLQSGLATAAVALKASETRHEKQLQDQIKQLDAKVSRGHSSLQAEMRTEIAKVRVPGK